MKNLLFILGITVCFSLNGQKFYSIEKIGSKYSSFQIEEALNKADWCNFILTKDNQLLNFDDGTIIKLFSESQLSEFDKNKYSKCNFQENKISNSVFSIHPSGYILQAATKNNHIKSFKHE